jgi:3',5'-cyclic-nucleotide phosphodiesterase
MCDESCWLTFLVVVVVYVCPTGLSCLARIARLNNAPTSGLVPTVVLIDIPEDDDENERRRSLPQHDAGRLPESSPPNIYGTQLLRQIVADIREMGVASMVLPVAVIRTRIETPNSTPRPSTPIRTIRNTQASHPRPLSAEVASMQLPRDQVSHMKYIDLGAVDVLENPIRREVLPSLAIHIYRVHKEFLQCGEHLTAPTQKHQSPWPGVPEEKPFAYLREVMVCDLAGQICGTIVDHPLGSVVMNVPNERKRVVIKEISKWGFSAHELSDDELLFATVTMLEHALSINGMDELRLPRGMFRCFASVEARSGPMMLPPVQPAC